MADDRPKRKADEIPGEREKQRRQRLNYDFRDTRKELREMAMAQLPPGQKLRQGDVKGVKDAILGALQAHPDLFTSQRDMANYLYAKHGVNYTPERIGQHFRELGIGLVDGTYMILPMTMTQGDAWEQFADDLKVFLAGDPKLNGDVVCLTLRGGTTELVNIDLEGVRLDPSSSDRIQAVTTGWSDVVVHFRNLTEARRFWAKCMKVHRPNWDDPTVTDPKNAKAALLAILKEKSVIGFDPHGKALKLSKGDFDLLMQMLMKEWPISKQGDAYSLHTGNLFWKEQGVGGTKGIGWKSEAQLSESETGGDDDTQDDGEEREEPGEGEG